MFGWLKQLVGAEATAAVGASAPRVARPATAATAANEASGPAAAPSGFGIQRPLVGTQGRVAGFEYLLPPTVAQRLASRGDLAARSAHSALLVASMGTATRQGRPALTELSASVLARPGVCGQVADGTWLCLPDLADLPADISAQLRERGARLGATEGPPENRHSRAASADFVCLRASGDDVESLLLSAQRWQEARPGLPLVATGLVAADDIERALQAGFTLAGGQLARRRISANKPLNAAAHRICGLLSRLAMNSDTAEVAEAVRADVALSYRLLRYANSPALGLTRGVETAEQAVLLLGRRELTRWLQMLLMGSAASRQATAAMQEQALARGRLMELLAGADSQVLEAAADSQAAAGALFSVGLFSMLETLLETPLAQALAPLRLSEAANQALLHGQGPWAEHLQLVTALDSNDSGAAELLAARWGGMDAVQVLSDAAWTWAAATLETQDSKKPVN